MAQRRASASEKQLPLPSLHALRVFEAVARHMSFTRAASELCISQTAVSHQVKALELELGVALFQRAPRRLTLTAAGKSWALELGEVFSRLHAINDKLRRQAGSERAVVAVSIIPSFGSRWLVPRLGKFLDRNPDVEVRISASTALVDFAREDFDLGIRYGSGRYPGLVTEKLADDAWVVVCTPALAARHKLRAPRDLERQLLLQDDERDGWKQWCAQHRLGHLSAGRRMEFTDSSMLIEAALRGQGVALARWSLALDELAAGRLVRPFPKLAPLVTGLAYYLAAPRENFRRPPVAAFRDWLRSEAESLRWA